MSKHNLNVQNKYYDLRGSSENYCNVKIGIRSNMSSLQGLYTYGTAASQAWLGLGKGLVCQFHFLGFRGEPPLFGVSV